MSQFLNKLLMGVSRITGWIRILQYSSGRVSLPCPAKPFLQTFTECTTTPQSKEGELRERIPEVFRQQSSEG